LSTLTKSTTHRHCEEERRSNLLIVKQILKNLSLVWENYEAICWVSFISLRKMNIIYVIYNNTTI
ncbi:MAG: hypothetical protein AAB347_04605, partial [Bacteroidota bacterium]